MITSENKQPFLRQLSPAAPDCPAISAAAPQWLVTPFRAISLQQLNGKADMLRRLDNKYVVRAPALQRAMPLLAQYFDVLEIEGRRDFTYETCYFDDRSRTNYFDQHRGRRKRCKVRMRKYVDADLCFVEVKLKAKRSITIKKRLACEPAQYGTLDQQAQAFIDAAYRQQYGADYDLTLEPVVEMRYQRVTLVAKQGGERMTIDFALEFAAASGTRNVDAGLFLLETKSANANGVADKIMRALHEHPTDGCSKYCVAMATLKEVSKYNKFLVALRRLDIVPAYGKPLAATGSQQPQPMAWDHDFQSQRTALSVPC